MLGDVVGMGKSFSTLLTTIKFFPSVCSHVSGQAAVLGKSSPAILAAMRFFSSVSSHVRR